MYSLRKDLITSAEVFIYLQIFSNIYHFVLALLGGIDYTLHSKLVVFTFLEDAKMKNLSDMLLVLIQTDVVLTRGVNCWLSRHYIIKDLLDKLQPTMPVQNDKY